MLALVPRPDKLITGVWSVRLSEPATQGDFIARRHSSLQMSSQHDDTGSQRRDTASKPLPVQSPFKNSTHTLERSSSWQWLGLGRNSIKTSVPPTASIDEGPPPAEGDAADTGPTLGATLELAAHNVADSVEAATDTAGAAAAQLLATMPSVPAGPSNSTNSTPEPLSDRKPSRRWSFGRSKSGTLPDISGEPTGLSSSPSTNSTNSSVSSVDGNCPVSSLDEVGQAAAAAVAVAADALAVAEGIAAAAVVPQIVPDATAAVPAPSTAAAASQSAAPAADAATSQQDTMASLTDTATPAGAAAVYGVVAQPVEQLPGPPAGDTAGPAGSSSSPLAEHQKPDTKHKKKHTKQAAKHKTRSELQIQKLDTPGSKRSSKRSGLPLPVLIALGVAAVGAAAGAVWWLLKRRGNSSADENIIIDDEDAAFEAQIKAMEEEEKKAAAADAAAAAAAAADPAAAAVSAEEAELAVKQAEAARKEKILAAALAQEDAEMAKIDALHSDDLIELGEDELAELEAELAELEAL